MRRLLAALLLFPALAHGQTIPNGGIVAGQTWTINQWNTALSSFVNNVNGTCASCTITNPTVSAGTWTGGILTNSTFVNPTIGTLASLGVTGNATVGGALGVTGATTFGTNTATGGTWNYLNGASGNGKGLQLETGGTLNWLAGANSAATGSGNSGSDFIINRYDNSGNQLSTVLTISRATGMATWANGTAITGGTATDYLSQNAATVWSGSVIGAANTSGLYMLQAHSGATTGASPELNYLGITDTVNTTGQNAAGVFISHSVGAGAKGGRVGLLYNLNQTATSTGYTGGTVAAFWNSTAFNMGGTGLTSGTALGSQFGINPQCQLGTGATYIYQNVCQEIDIGVATGASVLDNIGMQIVQLSNHAVAGSRDDVGFSLNNQSGALGWTYGLEFGRAGGVFPIASTGTMIYGQGNLGAGFAVANGIDWHLGTFTGNTWNDGHVTISGAGLITAPSLTLAGLAVHPSLTGTTASIGGSALLAGARSTGAVTVTGATASMGAVANPTTYPGDGFDWSAYISATNTVTVKVCGFVAGTPVASTYDVRVIQ